MILCLALCACNNAGEEAPTAGDPSNAPTSNVTGEETPAESGETPTDSAEDPEPTDKGLFVTDPEPVLTLPHSFGAVVLPEEEFGDDIEGISSSRPLDETVPDDSEPAATKPNTSYNPPVTLPEDVFDFD